MTAELLARLGGPVAAAGLALLLLTSPRRTRLAGLALWAVGMSLYLPLLAPSGHRSLLAAGGVLALAVAALLGLLFRRWPWALALLTLAVVPARIPVTVGDTSALLLVPLYAVVAGAAVALGRSLWRDHERRRELGAVAWPLALLVLWFGLSGLWSDDPRRAAVELFFFVLPFTLLALALARMHWSELALAWLFRLLLAMALVFAAVGIGQWSVRDVFWNPKVMAGNAYASFFRVNSLFWDPSIYGRFLVVAILVALVVCLFGVWRRVVVPLALAVVFLWVGLLFSFSQSSFVALVAGVLLAGLLAWRTRATLAIALVAAVAVPLALGTPDPAEAGRGVAAAAPGNELNRATRGRFKLIANGLRIAADHPVAGVGVGGFSRSYTERFGAPRRQQTPASHTTPVTVVAETGVIGLGLFAWLVVAAFGLALRGPSLGLPFARLARTAAGVGLAAIFIHSLFYNAFFEDPMVWGFFALAALAAQQTAAPGRGAD